MDRGGMRGWVSLFWECESDFRSITSMKTIQKAELNYSTIQIQLCDTPLLQIAESRPVSHTPVNCQNIPPLPGKLINCLRLVVQQWKTGLGGGVGGSKGLSLFDLLCCGPQSQSWPLFAGSRQSVESVESSIQLV